jgi:spore coat protein U-like protein
VKVQLRCRWSLLIGASAALAAASLAVPAAAQCTIAVTAGVAFGSYDVFAATPTDTAGEVRVTCASRQTNVRVTMDRGGASTFQPRQMANGAERLAYNLFLDASRSQIWGDGTGGTVLFGPVAINRNQTRLITVYGRIPATQDVAVGSYSDLVVATVTF